MRSRQSSRPVAVIASDTVPHGEGSAPVEEHSADEISAENAAPIRQLRLEDRMCRAARSEDGGGGTNDGSSSDASMGDVWLSADAASDEELRLM